MPWRFKQFTSRSVSKVLHDALRELPPQQSHSPGAWVSVLIVFVAGESCTRVVAAVCDTPRAAAAASAPTPVGDSPTWTSTER